MHPNILEREKLVQALLDEFAPQKFEWGKYDCGKMVIRHLKAAGYKINTGGTWSSQIGLMRFLRRHGGSGAACLDGWGLARIPPARAMMADIVEIDGADSPFGAFGIVVGNGRVLAYHEAVETLAVIQPAELIAAWGV